MSQAVLALLGVLLGAAATYFSTAATERSRWRRAQSVRWDERRLATYTEYAHTLKQLITLVVRIAAHEGIHPEDDPLDPAAGLPLLAAVGEERTVKWEAVLLLGSPDVIRAARTWHQSAGTLQMIAQGQSVAQTWLEAIEAASDARRGFYEAVRRDLGIPLTGSAEVFEWRMGSYLRGLARPAIGGAEDGD